MTSGQKTEQVYSFNPAARTELLWVLNVLRRNQWELWEIIPENRIT